MKRIPDRLRRLRGSPESLRARSISASLWALGGTLFQRALSLGSNLIMTRLLVPEAFGLMAIVVTVMVMVEMISDIGVNQSVIRSHRGGDLHYLRAAWTVQIIRSTTIALLVVACGIGLFLLGPGLAPPDSVYADPRLPPLVVASSLAVLFRGLESTGMALAGRRLMMRKVTMIEIGAQAITLVLMISFALISATVWVLLLGMLTGAFLRMVWTHLAFRDTPMRVNWDRGIAAEMWNYGRWLILSSMAGFVVNQGDKLFLGAMLDKTTFGVYAIAAIWMDVGQTLVKKVGGQVVMAGFAETLRERPAHFPTFFRRVRRVYDLLTGGAFLACFLLGGAVITLLYAPAYHDAGWMLALLSFRFLARRQSPVGALLLSGGDSRAMAASVVVTAIGMVVLLPLVFHYGGLPATVLAVALMPMVGSPTLFLAAAARYKSINVRSDLIYNLVAALLGIAVLASGAYRLALF